MHQWVNRSPWSPKNSYRKGHWITVPDWIILLLMASWISFTIGLLLLAMPFFDIIRVPGHIVESDFFDHLSPVLTDDQYWLLKYNLSENIRFAWMS
jgi:hypothetical protein